MLEEIEVREQLFALARTTERAGQLYGLHKYSPMLDYRRGLLDLAMAGTGINLQLGLVPLLMRSGVWSTPPRYKSKSYATFAELARQYCHDTLFAAWGALDPSVEQHGDVMVVWSPDPSKSLDAYSRFLGANRSGEEGEIDAVEKAMARLNGASSDRYCEGIAFALRDPSLQLDASALVANLRREFEEAIAIGKREGKMISISDSFQTKGVSEGDAPRSSPVSERSDHSEIMWPEVPAEVSPEQRKYVEAAREAYLKHPDRWWTLKEIADFTPEGEHESLRKASSMLQKVGLFEKRPKGTGFRARTRSAPN